MNPEAQEELNRILKVGADSATPEDMAFLRARRSYLTTDQKAVFGLTEEVADEAPARKGKKSASTDEA